MFTIFIAFFALTFASAQDLTSDGCYRIWKNCIVVDAQPYDRKSFVDEPECRSRCLTITSGVFNCRSAIYDKQNRVCDLYAHTGNTYPAKLIQYYGRDYYEPTGNCSSIGVVTTTTSITTTSVPVPSIATCPAGQQPRLLRTINMELVGNDDVILSLSESECISTCLTNKAPSGQTVPCVSYDYDRNAGECKFSINAAIPKGTGTLRTTNNVWYYEKICFAANTVANCDDVADRIPQMILIGFAERVVDVLSLEACVEVCVATPGCLSGMYYYNEATQNCILNSENRVTQSQLFTRENVDNVDYFDSLICRNGNGRRRLGTSISNRILSNNLAARKTVLDRRVDSIRRPLNADDAAVRTIPAERGQWSEWGPCDRAKEGRRVRYRVCGNNDVSRCPFETEWCERDASARLDTTNYEINVDILDNVGSQNERRHLNRVFNRPVDPIPVMDSDGNAKACGFGQCCPHRGSCRIGIITFSSGKQTWCSDPCKGHD